MGQFRRPNRSQHIFCVRCQKRTTHTIPDLDSAWETVGEIRMYNRWHSCGECGNFKKTCELSRAVYDKMVSELTELRLLKETHDKLLAALERKREAEAEIGAFFAHAGTSSDDAT